MNKDIDKKDVDDVNLDQTIVNEMISKKTNDITCKKKITNKHYIIVLSSLLLVIFGIFMSVKFSLAHNNVIVGKDSESVDNAANPSNNTVNQVDNDPLPEIKDNYVAFNDTEYSTDLIKLPGPDLPLDYDVLKNESFAVITGTIKKVGVYKKNVDQYNIKGDLGTYIYTVKIDRILKGSINNKVYDIVPISERALAWPTFNGDKIQKWNFEPYSYGARETFDLRINNQYIMFLCNKDKTGCYQLSYNGFGFFPINYINKLSEDYTLKEVEDSGIKGYPLENDYLFKVCSMHVKEDFLK